MTTFKLYEISNEYERAIDALLNEELTDESKIEELKDLFDNKCINVAKYIKNLETEQEAINNVIKNMSLREKKVIERINSLTAYLKFNMEKTGLIDPIKCPEFSIKFRNNPPSLVIEDETLIPNIYIITKEVKSIDKNAIKKDILDGFEVDGARVENKKTLVIK